MNFSPQQPRFQGKRPKSLFRGDKIRLEVTTGGSELWKGAFPSRDLELPKTEQLCLQWQQTSIQSQC